MSRTRLFILLISVISISLKLTGQNLQFYREDIHFGIQKDNAVTDAVYNFCNLGEKDIRISLFYPFPENTMDLIDSLVIEDLKDHSILPYREAVSGVFFGISVKAYGQASYRVYFRQRLKEKNFKYILTSTESWGRSLEFANFELRMPDSLTPDSLSYAPDTSFIQNNLQYFIWKKTDFMPVRDFEVKFH